MAHSNIKDNVINPLIDSLQTLIPDGGVRLIESEKKFIYDTSKLASLLDYIGMAVLHIITPMNRPENAGRIFESIKGQLVGRVIWHCIYDGAADNTNTISHQHVFNYTSPVNNALAGHAHRNIILDQIEALGDPCAWIYFLDDDNILKPGMIEEINRAKEDILVVDQVLKDGRLRLRADKDNLTIGAVDTAMFAFRVKTIRGTRFENKYEADGIFINKIQHNGSVKIVNEPLSYYNYLR